MCGFMGWPSMELCARWAAAGAWYPFARFHHADGFAEPFRSARTILFRPGDMCHNFALGIAKN